MSRDRDYVIRSSGDPEFDPQWGSCFLFLLVRASFLAKENAIRAVLKWKDEQVGRCRRRFRVFDLHHMSAIAIAYEEAVELLLYMLLTTM